MSSSPVSTPSSSGFLAHNNDSYEKHDHMRHHRDRIHITAVLGGNFRKVQDHLNKDLYVEYDVVCTLETDRSYHKWSVWRRYSEFKRLHGFVCADMKAVKKLSFPKPHNFTSKHFDDDFIEQRKNELISYWNELIAIVKIENSPQIFETFLCVPSYNENKIFRVDGQCIFPDLFQMSVKGIYDVTVLCYELGSAFCGILNLCSERADNVLWDSEGRKRLPVRQSMFDPYNVPPRVPRWSPRHPPPPKEPKLINRSSYHEDDVHEEGEEDDDNDTTQIDIENTYLKYFSKKPRPVALDYDGDHTAHDEMYEDDYDEEERDEINSQLYPYLGSYLKNNTKSNVPTRQRNRAPHEKYSSISTLDTLDDPTSSNVNVNRKLDDAKVRRDDENGEDAGEDAGDKSSHDANESSDDEEHHDSSGGDRPIDAQHDADAVDKTTQLNSQQDKEYRKNWATEETKINEILEPKKPSPKPDLSMFTGGVQSASSSTLGVDDHQGGQYIEDAKGPEQVKRENEISERIKRKSMINRAQILGGNTFTGAMYSTRDVVAPKNTVVASSSPVTASRNPVKSSGGGGKKASSSDSMANSKSERDSAYRFSDDELKEEETLNAPSTDNSHGPNKFTTATKVEDVQINNMNNPEDSFIGLFEHVANLHHSPHWSHPPMDVLIVGFHRSNGGVHMGTNNFLRKFCITPYINQLHCTDSYDVDGGTYLRNMVTHIHNESEIIYLVGGDKNPEYPSTNLYIWDVRARKRRDYHFGSQILQVVPRVNRVIVVKMTQVCVLDTDSRNPIKELLRYKTYENSKGLIAVTTSNSVNTFAVVGTDRGSVRVIHDNEDNKTDVVIKAHDSSLAALAISTDGKLLATASEKGTVIKLFSTQTGKIVKELGRGKNKAQIYSISFSHDAKFLAVSSDRDTIHVFNTYHGRFADKSLQSVAQIKDVKRKNIPVFDESIDRLHVIIANSVKRYYNFRTDGEGSSHQLIFTGGSLHDDDSDADAADAATGGYRWSK